MKDLKILLAAALLLLAGCGVKVQTAYDHRVDFKKYKTFCWMKGCEFTYTGPAYLNQKEVKQYIQEAIIAEMKEKGFELNSDQPDLLIDVHISMKDETVMEYHRNERDELYYKYYEEPQEITLLKGTLVIDMADKQESRMVWRSVAVSYLDLHPDLTQENIRKGIRLVLKEFPPEKKPISSANLSAPM
jgi:hypothetical protein